jgi:hypothetical protein
VPAKNAGATQRCVILYTVIRFVLVSAKFDSCTVVSVNGTLVEAKMCTFTLESTHFIFNEHETDYSVSWLLRTK